MTIAGFIYVFFIGEFSKFLKLHIKKVEINMKRLYIFGIISIIMIPSIILFDTFVFRENLAFIGDILIPFIFALSIYFITCYNKEKYEISQKVNAIPEVKKANNLFIIFSACYLGIPLIIVQIYMVYIRKVIINISNLTAIIIFFYLLAFIIPCIYFSKPYIRYYKKYVEEIEKNAMSNK